VISKDEFWKNKIPIGFYDNLYTKGQNKKKGLQSTWHHLTFLKLKKYINTNFNHLDYACGPGTFIGNYINSNSIGYDIAENQIDFAVKKYSTNKKSFTSDKNQIDKVGYFDVITVMGLIEVLTIEEFLSELDFLYSILKPKGKLIFVTPNYGGLMYFLEKLSNLFNSVNYGEVKTTFYNKKKIKNILKTCTQSSDIKFTIKCILNFGILLSVFNKNLGIKLEKFLENIFKNFFGFLLVIEIEKN